MKFYKEFAKYYHLHTPDKHYASNIGYINFLIKKHKVKSVLDVGCGNGASLANIFYTYKNSVSLSGFDISDEMIKSAKSRGLEDVIFFKDNMLEFQYVNETFDFILSLSWVINYVKNKEDITKVLTQCFNHLNPKGIILFEIAHCPHMLKYVFCDKQQAIIDDYHSKKQDDIFLFFKFIPLANDKLKAIYNLIIQSQNIIMYEEHILSFCNAYTVKEMMLKVGFKNIVLMDNAREHNLHSSYNILIKGEK